MTAPWMFRSLAVALFAVCAGLAALPGCGGPAPQAEKKDDKKDDKKADPGATPGPNPGPGPTPPEVSPKSTLGNLEKAADDAATAFRRDLVHGTAKAEALSAAFLKVVGKPLLFDGDKAKGYSADSAVSWMKKVGDGIGFGPELQRQQAGDVAYLRGLLQGKPGGYSLRLLREGGAWKVDWLALSSVDAGTLTTTPTPEGAAQGFAVAAFVESITDAGTMPEAERAPLIGGALAPAVRTAWAPPFDQDKAAGYDYNPAALVRKAKEIGGGTTAYTASRVGDLPEFKVELTKPAGKKAFTVRLVKGPAPHEWLVSEILEPKG